MQDPIEIATDTGSRLDALGVAWVIGGSIASSLHGEPRSTQDVDMVVALRVRHVTPFVRAMGSDYYVDPDAMRVAVTTGESFNTVHFASAIKVDFFVAGDDPFEAERLESRQRIEMPNGALFWICSSASSIPRRRRNRFHQRHCSALTFHDLAQAIPARGSWRPSVSSRYPP